MKNTRPTAIELFCGVGGMTLGFEQAGFDVLAAFDIDELNIQTHERNFPRTKAFATDLSKHSGDDLRAFAKLKRRKIDVVIGGPPCQGFSVGGKRDLNDKRNLLIYDFARVVRQVRPRYFVLENVQGLMTEHSKPVLNSFLRRIKRAGYQVVEPIRVLNAADYGVPQRRKRTIILGYLKGEPEPEYPKPTGCFTVNGKSYFPDVSDALSDLPNVDDHEVLFKEDAFAGSLKQAKNTYALLMRGLLNCPNDYSYPRIVRNKVLSGCL